MRPWALAVLACAATGLFAADLPDSHLPPAWANWHYWRPLGIPPTDSARLARATLPIEVYAHAQVNLDDLRLIDDTWSEVPFVLEARQGHRTRQWRDASVVDLGDIPGVGTHLVAEIPADIERHNSIEILTDDPEFVAFVEVAASGSLPSPQREESAWRIVRDSAHIFRLRKDGLEGVQTVSYPDSTARFLRLRIRREEGKGLKLTGIRVAYEEVVEPGLAALPMDKVTEPQGPKGQSLWQVDLGTGQVPVSQVRFEVGTPEFHRAAEVWTSEDGKEWARAGGATLHRVSTPRGALTRGRADAEQAGVAQLSGGSVAGLVVEFPERRGRYWRVAVTDRNDAPLSGVRIQLWGTPRHLIFRQEPRRTYRLIYGNERAKPPQYELAQLLGREEQALAVPAVVGGESLNDAWVDPRPWSEQHPVLLWIALGIVVVALGLLALRSLRQAA